MLVLELAGLRDLRGESAPTLSSFETTSVAAPGPPRPRLLDIALVFAIVSTTSFGGGSIPAMRREAKKRGWLDDREFLEIYGLAQVSPGAIPVSVAVLIGRRLRGNAGFAIALAAETLPGFVILMALALASMDPHMGLLRAALRGAAAAAVGLVLGNAIELSWPYRAKPVDVALLVAVALAVVVLHFSLALTFLIFIPLSIALQRAVRAV